MAVALRGTVQVVSVLSPATNASVTLASVTAGDSVFVGIKESNATLKGLGSVLIAGAVDTSTAMTAVGSSSATVAIAGKNTRIDWYYKANVTTTESKTITVTVTGGAQVGDDLSIIGLAFSGVATASILDGSATTDTGLAADFDTNPTINCTSSQANDLMLHLAVNYPDTVSPYSGFTQVECTTNWGRYAVQYLLDTGTAGTETVGVISTFNDWAQSAFLVKIAGGGATKVALIQNNYR